MILADGRTFRCSRCHQAKPLTLEHFYVDARGLVTGYCKPCHRAYLRERYHAGLVVRPPGYQRESYRRRFAVPPERWRIGRPPATEEEDA